MLPNMENLPTLHSTALTDQPKNSNQYTILILFIVTRTESFFKCQMAMSREVRNLGTPRNELSCA